MITVASNNPAGTPSNNGTNNQKGYTIRITTPSGAVMNLGGVFLNINTSNTLKSKFQNEDPNILMQMVENGAQMEFVPIEGNTEVSDELLNLITPKVQI